MTRPGCQPAWLWSDLPDRRGGDHDISAIVNAHREGLLCIPSVRSAAAAARRAREAGLGVEVVLALDSCDPATREVARALKAERLVDVVLQTDIDDLGGARNVAAERARGRWVAFLDGDDLWCEDWLVAAHRAAEAEPRVAVWHPEINVYFGERWSVVRHVDMDDPSFRLPRLAFANSWTSASFTRRGLLARVPYPATDLSGQIGFEDWGWNIRTVEAGAVHKVVSGTVHGLRVKPRSLVQRTNAAAAMPPSSQLFRRILTARAPTCRSRPAPL